jgi:histidine triad (HIT) family protein
MCEYCDIIDGARSAWKLYEDDKVIAVLSESPATFGHILAMPKHHHQIIEQVPDYIISHLFGIVNKILIAAFEALGAHGTNILINNGPPAGQTSSHFLVHIVPRRENDSINLQWQPKSFSQDQLSTIELELNEFTKNIGDFEKEKPKPINLDEETPPSDHLESEETSYQVRHLTRIP